MTPSSGNDSVVMPVRDGMRSGAPMNETGLSDADLDEAYEDVVSSFDDDRHALLVGRLQKIEHERSGYLVWGIADGIDLISTKVRDPPTLSGDGRTMLESTWIGP
jgi:peptide/nickel transport system substrate-binding protein